MQSNEKKKCDTNLIWGNVYLCMFRAKLQMARINFGIIIRNTHCNIPY